MGGFQAAWGFQAVVAACWQPPLLLVAHLTKLITGHYIQ